MARYNRDGTIYSKSVNSVVVPHDGAPYTLAAKLIPPYIAVNRYWVTGYIIDKSATGHDPWAKATSIVSGAMTNVVLDTGADDFSSVGTQDGTGALLKSDQDHLNGFVQRYLPTVRDGDPSFWDQDVVSGPEVDAGLTGSQIGIAMPYKDKEFFNRETIYGLGRNSIMTQSNKIRFCSEFRVDGSNIGRGCDISSWRLVAIQGWSADMAPNMTNDAEMLLAGNSSGNLDELAQAVHGFFGNQGQSSMQSTDGEIETPAAIRMGIADEDTIRNSQINYWLTSGWSPEAETDGEADHTEQNIGWNVEADFVMQMKVTLELKVLTERVRNIWTPN